MVRNLSASLSVISFTGAYFLPILSFLLIPPEFLGCCFIHVLHVFDLKGPPCYCFDLPQLLRHNYLELLKPFSYVLTLCIHKDIDR